MGKENEQHAKSSRRIHLLGDGSHGEKRPNNANPNLIVEESPLDLIKSYRIAYMAGMYIEPEAEEAASFVSMQGPGCPCNTTF